MTTFKVRIWQEVKQAQIIEIDADNEAAAITEANRRWENGEVPDLWDDQEVDEYSGSAEIVKQEMHPIMRRIVDDFLRVYGPKM